VGRPPVSALGRRPGHPETRAEILEAARALFAADGYEGTSLRAIARLAGVDPALVHHYFADKPALFMAAMRLPFDPRPVQEYGETGGFSGARVVQRFIEMWDEAQASETAFVTVAQAVCASPAVADAVREFVGERIFRHAPGDAGRAQAAPLAMERRALISSQLIGLAWSRYVMRLEPVASAEPTLIAGWVGPTIDRYAVGEID